MRNKDKVNRTGGVKLQRREMIKSIGKFTENEFINNLRLKCDKMKSKDFITLESNNIACDHCYFLFLSIGNFCFFISGNM